jgi:hypothetical protein
MKSFSLLRTNVGLTTNVKVVCDSNYNLYLESIDSAPELSITRLKKLQFNKNNFFDELVPYFFKDFPVDIAYQIAYFEDNDKMSQDFASQYDDTYAMGARNIVDNKNYPEEYEYFAPLYVFKNSIPKYFIIFRIDGPGLDDLDKDSFRVDFLKKFKTVKVFDLTKTTPIGEWIERNFKNNISFPNTSLEIDFRNLEFSQWIGIDYETGGFTYKSQFLETSLENENTLFDFERFIFDGYKVNKLIHPQILNFSFLFDDTPATPTSLRRWSLNRYSGFYLDDLELIDTITPFTTPRLKDDVEILSENILYSPTGDPFEFGFLDGSDNWVEYGGNFYKVQKFTQTSENVLTFSSKKNVLKNTVKKNIKKTSVSKSLQQETLKIEGYNTVETVKYRIISELDLEGLEAELNTKTCYIDAGNLVVKLDGSNYIVDGIEISDINIIQIGDTYHNLILDENGNLKVFTDYGFQWSQNYRFEYFINYPEAKYYDFIDLEIKNGNIPISFKIFRLNFTDIKDFDTNIVDTEFSKFEYEELSEITQTEEPKMYTTDLRINSNPAPFNDYLYKEQVYNVPCSSDYTANLETFRIIDNDLSELWRMNPIHCRFAYQGSLSTGDYPYLLNNNDIHENFNRAVDTFESVPNRRTRNLDYFYTINSGRADFLHHSLHVERNFKNVQDSSFRFELDKYVNKYIYTPSGQTISQTYSSDYFSYFFGTTQSFLNGQILKKIQKWSLFDKGDKSEANTTVFRGLKFKIFEVEKIIKSELSLDEVNLFTSNNFEDYKLSILLSQNLQGIGTTGSLYDTLDWGYFTEIQDNYGYVSFKTSDNSTPSNVGIGDRVKIRQNYPKMEFTYDEYATVTHVGTLSYGGYGFEVNKEFLFTTASVGGSTGSGATISIDVGAANSAFPNIVISLTTFAGHGITTPTSLTITDINTSSGPEPAWIGQTLVFTPFSPTQLTATTPLSLPTNAFTSGILTDGGLSASVIQTPTASNTTGYYSIGFEWKIIKEWELDTQYYTNDYVLYDDVLYRVISNNLITDPNDDPTNLSQYYVASISKQPFWSPRASYSTGDWCYRQGDFYIRTAFSDGIDFYNTSNLYSQGNIISWRGRFYEAQKESTKIRPQKNKRNNFISEKFEENWKEVPNPKEWYAIERLQEFVPPNNLWEPIEVWSSDKEYTEGGYVAYDGALYQANQDILIFISDDSGDGIADENLSPDLSTSWTKIFSFRQDSNLEYSPVNNSIIQIGESYYLCIASSGSTLDSGIVIYINKKWKNILINININDGTTLNIDNSQRDLLYRDSNSRLTAASFIRQLNDLDTKYDFADFTSYVIIEEDGRINKYNFENNIENLPYLLICEEPDQFELMNNTLSYSPIDVTKTEIKSIRYLVNGKIDSIERLNYYNEIPLACSIERNVQEEIFGKNYNGRSNITVSKDASIKPKSNANLSETFYRHSGNYMPVFYDLQLFKPPSEFEERYGNYKFDDKLTFFGIMRQRVISKVNRKENILKLRNSKNLKSIYPMLDEFGYTVLDFFIFKSTWDYFYHVECENLKLNLPYVSNKLVFDRFKNKETTDR